MCKLFIISLFCVNYVVSQDVGDKCTTKAPAMEGTCTMISSCAPAMEAIRMKKYNEFNRCGFSGFEEIVCCPQTTTKFGPGEPVITQRIAVKECHKIIASSLPSLDLHILGGELATPGEFPHMVALGFDKGNGYDFKCGGSVLSPTYVLTAAHCIDNLEGIPPSIVRAGVVEIGGNEWNENTDIRIAETKINPRYTRIEKYHDLALLRLAKPLKFSSNLNAVCLETSSEDPRVPLTVTGWGKTSNTKDIKSTLLLKANVTAVDREKCGESYTQWGRRLPAGITADQLCAGDPEGLRDTCQGDSGGPLVVTSLEGQYTLVGVTSFGRGCGSPSPGVYTRISNYLDWIEGVVWPN